MADDQGAYRSYDGFLKATIGRYYASGANKLNFLALLLATREAWKVAFAEIATQDTGKKLLTGAAGVAVVTLLLRAFVGGPIGILLTGASIASLVALYSRNHAGIMARAEHYRGIVARYRPLFEELESSYVDGRTTESQHRLMVDGLMGRFIEEVDGFEPIEKDTSKPAEGGFAAHAARKREEEERGKD